MEAFHGFINDINGVLWSYVLVYLLLGVGIFFTIRFGFVQFRGLKRATQVVFAKAGPGENFLSGICHRFGVSGGYGQYRRCCHGD